MSKFILMIRRLLCSPFWWWLAAPVRCWPSSPGSPSSALYYASGLSGASALLSKLRPISAPHQHLFFHPDTPEQLTSLASGCRSADYSIEAHGASEARLSRPSSWMQAASPRGGRIRGEIFGWWFWCCAWWVRLLLNGFAAAQAETEVSSRWLWSWMCNNFNKFSLSMHYLRPTCRSQIKKPSHHLSSGSPDPRLISP